MQSQSDYTRSLRSAVAFCSVDPSMSIYKIPIGGNRSVRMSFHRVIAELCMLYLQQSKAVGDKKHKKLISLFALEGFSCKIARDTSLLTMPLHVIDTRTGYQKRYNSIVAQLLDAKADDLILHLMQKKWLYTQNIGNEALILLLKRREESSPDIVVTKEQLSGDIGRYGVLVLPLIFKDGKALTKQQEQEILQYIKQALRHRVLNNYSVLPILERYAKLRDDFKVNIERLIYTPEAVREELIKCKEGETELPIRDILKFLSLHYIAYIKPIRKQNTEETLALLKKEHIDKQKELRKLLEYLASNNCYRAFETTQKMYEYILPYTLMSKADYSTWYIIRRKLGKKSNIPQFTEEWIDALTQKCRCSTTQLRHNVMRNIVSECMAISPIFTTICVSRVTPKVSDVKNMIEENRWPEVKELIGTKSIYSLRNAPLHQVLLCMMWLEYVPPIKDRDDYTNYINHFLLLRLLKMLYDKPLCAQLFEEKLKAMKPSRTKEFDFITRREITLHDKAGIIYYALNKDWKVIKEKCGRYYLNPDVQYAPALRELLCKAGVMLSGEDMLYKCVATGNVKLVEEVLLHGNAVQYTHFDRAITLRNSKQVIDKLKEYSVIKHSF